jgi:hypothetical protein
MEYEMPAHYCIDPLDPYAEQEVRVTYDDHRPLVAIRSVIDRDGYEVLPELSDECLRVLQLEITAAHGRAGPYAWAQQAADGRAAPAAR